MFAGILVTSLDFILQNICSGNDRERDGKVYGNLSKFLQKQSEVFCKKDVLKNFAKFTEKHLFWSLFFKDTHREISPSNKIPALTKSTNMDI